MVVVALSSLVVTPGCSRGPVVTAADRTFVADMAPHHALGVRMAALALERADDVRVREFGFTMGRYQKAEFLQLDALARTWHAQPSDHIHGMLSAEEEASLGTLDAPAFDRTWLRDMIIHHEGAVAMATLEATTGSNPTAKAIAAAVVQVQTKEIAQMRSALVDLSAT
jgi:uncharacterized protein (DUF305 family)